MSDYQKRLDAAVARIMNPTRIAESAQERVDFYIFMCIDEATRRVERIRVMSDTHPTTGPGKMWVMAPEVTKGLTYEAVEARAKKVGEILCLPVS